MAVIVLQRAAALGAFNISLVFLLFYSWDKHGL